MRKTLAVARPMVMALVVLLAALSPFQHAHAQAYPSKPIRFIVIVAAGGGLDATARHIAARLGARLGQQGIVDNLAGSGGKIVKQYRKQAPPDGYTLL